MRLLVRSLTGSSRSSTPWRSCSPWPGPVDLLRRRAGLPRHQGRPPGGDDAIRPAFRTAAQLAPYGWGTYRLHQDLIGLRRRNPWLHRARTGILHLANAQVAYEACHDGCRLITALNVADHPARLPVPHARTIQAGGRRSLHQASTPDASIGLGPHGWAILTP